MASMRKCRDRIVDREVAKLERRQKIERDRQVRELRLARLTGVTGFKS
jgi:hypothetical protein